MLSVEEEKKYKQFTARKKMLDEQLGKVKNGIMGYDISFLPYITNKNGEISEYKIKLFINKLLDCEFNYNNPEIREFYGLFLYCAIKGIAEFDECDHKIIRFAQTFGDIIGIANHKNNFIFCDERVLYDNEVMSLPNYEEEYFGFITVGLMGNGGFFRYGDVLYEFLTGKSLKTLIPEAEFEKRTDIYNDAYAKACGYDNYEDLLRLQPSDDYLADDYDEYYEREERLWQEHLATLSDEERKKAEEEQRKIDEERDAYYEYRFGVEKENKQRINNFTCPEIFVEKYLKFRKLYFEREADTRRYLFIGIERIVEKFILRYETPCVCDEESFALMHNRFEKLSAAAQRDLARRVNKNDKG